MEKQETKKNWNERNAEYMAKRAERQQGQSWGMDDGAYDMAKHDPELFEHVYGERAAECVAKYERDQARCAALREKWKGCKITARVVDE